MATVQSKTSAKIDELFEDLSLVTVTVNSYGAMGNGVTNDTNAIHAARDAAGLGGVVTFMPGTYLVSGLNANVANQLWSLRPGATIKLIDSAGAIAAVTVAANGVTISGGAIDGNRANQNSWSSRGVYASGMTGVKLDGVYIYNTWAEGVRFDACSWSRIEKCTFGNCNQAGNLKAIMVTSVGGSFSGVWVERCIIDATVSTNGGLAFYVPANTATDLHAHNNTMLLGDHAQPVLGIEYYSNTGGTILRGSIVDNHVSCPGTGTSAMAYSIGGIATTTSTGNMEITVTGNTAVNCRTVFVELIGRNLTCVSNTSTTSGRIAVPANDVAGGIKGVVVADNVLSACTDVNFAIQLNGTATNALYGVICTGNVIEDPAGPGIVIANQFLDGIVADNVIRSPGWHGIVVNSSTTTTGSVIRGNRIDLTGAPASKDCIMIASSTATDLLISDNICTAATNHGINIPNAVNRVVIMGNTCSGCVNGITTGGGDRIAILNNYCHDNSNRGISVSGTPTNTTMANNVCSNNTTADYATSGTFAPFALGSTVTATAPPAGGAGALPATPLGYLIVNVNGTDRKMPYYTNS